MKKINFILFIMSLYILKRSLIKKLPPLDADIVISPGGFKGLYSLGICHYIKNNFDISKKKIAGFSSGAFNSLFMTMNREKENEFMRLMFGIKPRISIDKLLGTTVRILNNLKYEDVDLKRVKIGVTTSNGLKYFDNFLSLQDAIYCCKCSSFIPFVTCNDIFLFYKNNLTLDGGIYYQMVKRNKIKGKLYISTNMFGRYKCHMTEGLKRPTCSYYQLYLYGYNDARKNHDMLKAYFDESSS